MTIHSVVIPRELREEPAAGPSVHCGEEEMFVVTVCQNSGVAIFVPMTSNSHIFKGQRVFLLPVKASVVKTL
jgi:hypothetical protein